MDEKVFRDLYRKCLRKNLLTKGNIAGIKQLISNTGITSFVVEEYDHSSFINIPGFKININGKIGFFPKFPVDKVIKNRHGLIGIRERLLAAELVLPPYVQMGYVDKLASKIENVKDFEKEEIVSNAFYKIYCIDIISTCYVEIYSVRPAISPFKTLIIEGIEAFYQGLDHLAIMVLFPCIEGTIRNLGKKVAVNGGSQIDKNMLLEILTKCQRWDIRQIVYSGYDWVPNDYLSIEFFDKFYERVQVIESLKFYIEKSLYEHTNNFDSETGLNRHGILHGFITDYHSANNFYRLITVLNILAFASTLVEGSGSLFFPKETELSKKFKRHLRLVGEFGDLREANLKKIGLS